jgi:hypothetical protein
MKRLNKKVKATKETKVSLVKVAKVLGECHDGEDLKCEMPDGTVSILPKELVEL